MNASAPKVLTIKITLNDSTREIWRRFQVLDTMTLGKLHDVIQIVMGWHDSHLHEFEQGKKRYSKPDPEDYYDPMVPQAINEDETGVDEVLKRKRQKLKYIYDMGDNWGHTLILEDISNPVPEQFYPNCLEGENACPPEDCGGAWGYHNLLEALADPEHDDHEMFIEWIDPAFDASKFDLNEVNEVLKDFENYRSGWDRFENGQAGWVDVNGLTPEQVSALVYSDWTAESAGLQCNTRLALENADTAEIFHNTRIFLNALIETGGTKTTGKGNLNRKFVAEVINTMRWPKGFREEAWRFNKVLNEEDVSELNVINLVCHLAGLTRKYKGQLVATKKARALLADDQAGELYALLFLTHMRVYNLGYWDRMPDYPAVQQTLGYSFYILGEEADIWASVPELSKKMFLPSVAAEMVDPMGYIDPAELILIMRVLRPLVRFGLIEGKNAKDAIYPKLAAVKKTPLFNEFLHFELPESN